jgi:hypothetical protein
MSVGKPEGMRIGSIFGWTPFLFTRCNEEIRMKMIFLCRIQNDMKEMCLHNVFLLFK